MSLPPGSPRSITFNGEDLSVKAIYDNSSVGMFSATWSTRFAMVSLPIILRMGMLAWKVFKNQVLISTEISETRPMSLLHMDMSSLSSVVISRMRRSRAANAAVLMFCSLFQLGLTSLEAV